MAMTYRGAGRLVGLLFIVATVAGILAAAVSGPVADADTDIVGVALHDTQVATGVLLELLMGAAVLGIVVVIWPVLREYSERLAVGYAVARTLEGALYVISALAALTLLSASRDAADAAAADAGGYQWVAALVVSARDWGNYVLLVLVFAVSAMILNTALYRSQLVPQWLSIWGLIGAMVYLLAGVLVLYGLDPSSPWQVVLVAPLGVQEMALAIWLLAKGFVAPTAAPERRSHPERAHL